MKTLESRWLGSVNPALIKDGQDVFFEEITNSPREHLSMISRGEVVALIGDFDAGSISDMINLIDRGAILVPLSPQQTRTINISSKVQGLVGLYPRVKVRKLLEVWITST